MAEPAHFREPILAHARRDFALLRESMTVDEALAAIRQHGVGERLIYFYVAAADGRLAGVLPTRRLLASPPESKLGDLMIRKVVTIPATATLLDALELFVLYKFFAFPVVDADRKVIAVVDVSSFTEEVMDFTEPEKVNDMFETLGFHITQVREASAFRAFRLRFPWLLATIGSGTTGALLAGFFEATLARAIILSFFLALVLALAESVSIQSMTLTLQALRAVKPTWGWFWTNTRRELVIAVLIGLGCGAIVFCIAFFWRGTALAAGVIAATIIGGAIIACLSGLIVPSVLHALKLDPKIAAGPITLALADVLTLLLYFSLATWLL
ncbi:MAG: magnesium transporter [Chthoniobacter sp.]|uniref:magnesium transporter n=1 Tax=Chthoniobacter sp. TaxID=2510640 RepID=UPI0032A489AD